MNLLNLSGYNLKGLSRNNFILGKNGCGKSYLLKKIELALREDKEVGKVKYLSPERGGLINYEPQIEQSISSHDQWLQDQRRQNQSAKFREQSAAQYRTLELLILREIEQNPSVRNNPEITFEKTLDRINKLLDRVRLSRSDSTRTIFTIHGRVKDEEIKAEDLSSGETELISLGIELLMFENECVSGKTNYLLFDEPDVHLHPDLQYRLARLIVSLATEQDITVLIATHSTAFLAAMCNDDIQVAFMGGGETDLSFSPADSVLQKIIPVFGAHPLSKVFNNSPVLLVEGDDDERIWQQAVRSSEERIRVYPCSVGGIVRLHEFEERTADIITAVYDNAIGYSLRDRDDSTGEIEDIGSVRRMRLGCRTAENLLLTDEVLQEINMPWKTLQSNIQQWLVNNTTHPHHSDMKAFADSGCDRKNGDVKSIRNDLIGLMGTDKPWEVIVGKVIGRFSASPNLGGEYSLGVFLGQKTLQELFGWKDSKEGDKGS